jgi:hypothetical protein
VGGLRACKAGPPEGEGVLFVLARARPANLHATVTSGAPPREALLPRSGFFQGTFREHRRLRVRTLLDYLFADGLVARDPRYRGQVSSSDEELVARLLAKLAGALPPGAPQHVASAQGLDPSAGSFLPIRLPPRPWRIRWCKSRNPHH